MNLIQRLMKNEAARTQFSQAIQSTGLRLVSTAVNLAIGILCARLLGDDGFGLYVAYLASAGLIASLSSVGLPTVLARELALARGTQDFSGLPVIVKGMLFVQTVALCVLAGAFLLGLTSITLTLLFVLGTNFLGIVTHVFIGFERVLITQWINSVIRPLLAIVLFLTFGWFALLTVEFAILIQAGTAVVASIVLMALWRGASLRAALPSLRRPCAWGEYIATFRTGIIVALTQTMIGATTQLDIIILTLVRSPEEVAWYYAAARGALVISFFWGSVAKLAEPKMVRLFASGDLVGVRALTRSTLLLGAVMTLGAILLAVALAHFYLSLYGDAFLAAFPAMVVLMLGIFATVLMGPAEAILRAARLDMNLAVLAGIAMVVGGFITVVLSIWIGILGAAIGSGVQFALFGFLQARVALNKTGISTTIWDVLRTGYQK